ncbi:MAG: NAD(P)-binding domain-containing protein [Pseudomonadales bacterium]|nr:NAD(P)-binding domain-containing protein [Pseudomonadales bacterium]NRA18275.1 NAD(P)-dependent oxidoreductase [Oceanospirillaceae bacterium]
MENFSIEQSQLTPENYTVAVAGCGSMGLPMLQNLAKAGYNCKGFDVRAKGDFSAVADLMEWDFSAFATNTEVVISVVRDYAQTLALCFDRRQGLFTRDQQIKYLIICSTLATADIADLATKLPEQVVLIDAPMSGAPVAAQEANLTFMVGATEQVFAQTKALFAVMGKQIHHTGPPGSGMAVKLLNNYVAATSVVAVRRVLAQASALGIDKHHLLEIMQQSSGATWFGNNFTRIQWAQQGYQLDNTMAILEKDVSCALQSMQQGTQSQKRFDQQLLTQLRTMPIIGSRES